MNGIEVKNISKRFGDILALDDVSLCFEENKIYGLLGRNGAGKTTLPWWLFAISNIINPSKTPIFPPCCNSAALAGTPCLLVIQIATYFLP